MSPRVTQDGPRSLCLYLSYTRDGVPSPKPNPLSKHDTPGESEPQSTLQTTDSGSTAVRVRKKTLGQVESGGVRPEDWYDPRLGR